VAKIRVLVVDDAVVFRRLVADELNKDPALEVVGTASNGKIALARISQVNPDIVILDIEMPEMDGLATLAELRKTWPRLPVIMFSALTERGAMATLDALALGATDYFTKPSSTGGLDASLEVLRTQLIPEIKALCQVKALPAAKPLPKSVSESGQRVNPSLSANRRAPASPVHILAIGSSTGGPNALADVFQQAAARHRRAHRAGTAHAADVSRASWPSGSPVSLASRWRKQRPGRCCCRVRPSSLRGTTTWPSSAMARRCACTSTRIRPKTRAGPPSTCCSARWPAPTARIP